MSLAGLKVSVSVDDFTSQFWSIEFAFILNEASAPVWKLSVNVGRTRDGSG